jgi:hypothetical protein
MPGLFLDHSKTTTEDEEWQTHPIDVWGRCTWPRRSRLSKRTSSTRWWTRPTIRQRVLGVGFPGHGCGHPMAKHDPPTSGTVRVGPVRALPQPPPRAEGQRRKRSRAADGCLAQQQLQAAGAGAAGRVINSPPRMNADNHVKGTTALSRTARARNQLRSPECHWETAGHTRSHPLVILPGAPFSYYA